MLGGKLVCAAGLSWGDVLWITYSQNWDANKSHANAFALSLWGLEPAAPRRPLAFSFTIYAKSFLPFFYLLVSLVKHDYYCCSNLGLGVCLKPLTLIIKPLPVTLYCLGHGHEPQITGLLRKMWYYYNSLRLTQKQSYLDPSVYHRGLVVACFE